jgi:hypothetical protein
VPRRLIAVPVLALVLAACSSGSSTPSATSSSGMAAPSSTSTSTSATSTATDQILPASPAGTTTTTQTAPKPVTPPAGIDGLLAWDTAGYPGPGTPGPGTLAHDHVDGPVTYAVLPPVGGPHAPIWMNAGVYTAPVPNERAVHDLEHGAVWITYDPKLPADQVATLTAFVAKQSMIAESGEGSPAGQANRYVVLSPWATSDLPSPIVISSWGYQLHVSDPTDSRLQAFVDTFRASTTYSPEAGSPVDGIPIGTGGRAASNGGAVPNPDGVVG